MSRVDFHQHSKDLLNAWKAVSNEGSDINWVVYGYEGNTSALKVMSTGDGGLEECCEEFSSGKIQYGYCSVVDPNTELNKFVLINWQGEAVPELRKGKCAAHFRDIKDFVKVAHVTINARNEDDIDVDDILHKVAKSSGSQYSIHKEKAKPIPEPKPVGSNYVRTNAAAEIMHTGRDKFWEASQREEAKRKQEEAKRQSAEKVRLDRERKEREAREAEERDRQLAERMRQVQTMRAAEKEAEEERRQSQISQGQGDVERDAMEDSEERRRRAESLRKEKRTEAAELIGQRTANPREMFETRRTSQFDNEEPERPSTQPAVPSRKLKDSFEPAAQPAVHRQADEPPVPRRDPSPPRPAPPSVPAPAPPQAAPVVSEPAPSSGYVKNLMTAPPEPVVEDDNPEWDDAETGYGDALPEYGNFEDRPPAAATTRAREPEPVPVQTKGAKSLSARALYDYQAEEDNEISFDPDDVITDIEQIDEGWWVGIGPDGKHGMFPANYVELIS